MTSTLSTPRIAFSAATPPGRVMVFANPFSGAGPNRAWVQRFSDDVAAAGLPAEVVWDASQRRATLARVAQELPAGAEPPWIIAAGGDGSVAAVLNDLIDVCSERAARLDNGHLGDPWPFATLPVGNENLFARHFGIDRRKPARLIDALVRGWTRPIDLGAVQSAGRPPRRFTLMASAGFDAEVVHRVDRWRHATAPAGQLRRVSLRSYLSPMAAALRAYRYPAVTLTPADGPLAGQPIHGRHAFVFNLPEYGKDLGICRHARADDGLLDFVVFTKPGPMRLLNYLRAAAMNARHLRRADVVHGQASRFTLTTPPDNADTPVPLQADGDPADHITADHPVHITAEPSALRIVHTTA